MNYELGTLSYFFGHAWDGDLSKIIGCAALIVVFGVWSRFSPWRKSTIYVFGVVLLFLSLSSPLDALSDDYLFSAHMIQHFILLMVVPPLLILGLPEDPTRALLSVPWVGKIERRLSEPVFAWVFANVILWVWHVPFLYDSTVRNEGVHIFEHLTFLVSATVFWWPVLAPTPESRLPFGVSLIYLFLAGLSNMALGILLTFLSVPVYEVYLAPGDPWRILDILRVQFHLGPLADQKLGGILMWVLGSGVFLGVILIQFARWYGGPVELGALHMEEG